MNIGQWVNLSVDDAIECFRWVYQNKPNSIFAEPMLAQIREWHIQYGFMCNLYVFEKCAGFLLEQLQERYWKELTLESNWLKLAWHSVKPEEIVTDDDMELASLQRVYHLITERSGEKSLWAKKVRLHRYQGSEKLLYYLEKLGVHTLLTADDARNCYQLTEAEMLVLQKQGYLEKAPFFYLRTDLRLDCIADGVTSEELLEQTEVFFTKRLWKPCLEVFFHEWRFKEIVSELECYWKGFGSMTIPYIDKY